MRQCMVSGCGKKLLARGWCAMHYWRWQKYGNAETEPPSRKKPRPVCGVRDCTSISWSSGYCNRHYKRHLRHGDPTGGAGDRDHRPIAERFDSGYKAIENGCWLWQHEFDPSGYGVMRDKGRSITAHRYAYLKANGLDDAPELDHICRTRKCVNPGHVRPVTRSQNMQNLATLKPTKSGYRGVAWHAHSKSWHVVVVHNHKQHSGGYFKDVHEAGLAAMVLRTKLYTHNEEDRRILNGRGQLHGCS